MVLHKKIEAAIRQTVCLEQPRFTMFENVKTTYYCYLNKSDVVAHGMIVGVEFLPPLTEKLGWWYKVFIYSIHVSSKEHSKMFGKIKIDVDNLKEFEIMDVYYTDIVRDKVTIDSTKLLSRFIEYRVNIIRDRKKLERKKQRLKC